MSNGGKIRNKPCSCGSGKKFKNCCMKKTSRISDGLSESEIKQIADTIQQKCIDKFGDNERPAKQFWIDFVTQVYEKDPAAVPVMIQAQPDPGNKQHMQKIYRGLKCSSN